VGDDSKILLTRPDGSQINVPYSDVDQYRALGYSEPSAESTYSGAIEAAKEEHYTSFGQKLKTGAEGLAAGLTFGLTTVLGADDEERERARYNPGTRLGSELVGGLAPALINPASLLGRGLAATPAGLAARGAEALAGATTATRVGHAVVRGAAEGAVLGGAAEATQATLDGSPLTAEALVAGMGWGALFGGALTGVTQKFGVYAEAKAAQKAEQELAETAKRELIPSESWNSFRSSVAEAKKSATAAVKAAAETAVKESADDLVTRVVEHAEMAEAAQKSLFSRIDAKGGWAAEKARGLKGEVMALRRQAAAAAAAENGDYATFERLSSQHADTMRVLAAKTGVVAPEMQPFVLQAAKNSKAALQEVQSLRAVGEVLDRFPATAEGFIAMKGAKAEKQIAAIEKFMAGTSAEHAPVREALKTAIDTMVSGTGLKIADSSPAGQLRALREISREAAKESSRSSAGGGAIRSAARYAGGKAGAKAAGNLGAGTFGKSLAFSGAANIVGGLLDLKSAILGRITQSVHEWGPGVAKHAQKVTTRVDPLRVRLDGSVDQAKVSRKELMAQRAKEVREAAPAVRDAMYKAVEPLAASHSELAVAMNRAAVAQFEALSQRLPRDPGTAFSNMRSLWKPDFIQTEQFARAYEVFQNPVGVAVRWLQNPKTVTPEGARMMRDGNPELWTHLRVEMLSRLSQPGILDRLTYSEQVGIGQMLDITVHSTQDPRFIKAQQEMFAERNQPLPTRPSASGNNSNNPSGVSRGMTSAQRITEH
jgi:hypothetical protein